MAAFVEERRPDFVVHAAAQRKPDEVERDFEAARRLNVEATAHLAAKLGESEVHCLDMTTFPTFPPPHP